MITQDILKSLFEYDKNTGIFKRISLKHQGIKNIDKVGYVNDAGYLLISVLNKRYRAHRLAWLYVTGKMPIDQIDHINLKRLDNRFCNLRECNNEENNRNSRKKSTNTSGYRGVHFNNQTNKWQARARVNGKRYHIGLFDSAEKAGIAYENFIINNHGEFANTVLVSN
jgi:hypothetical protein